MTNFRIRHLLAFVLIFLALLMLYSCTAESSVQPPGTAVQDFPTNTSPSLDPTPTQNPQPIATLGTEYQESIEHSQSFRRAQYTLTAELDYGLHRLDVEQEIIYTNNSPDSLPELFLMVEPQNYPGVFQLGELEMGGGSTLKDTHWDSSKLVLILSESLPPGESLILSISYQLQIPSPEPNPDIRPIPFGYTARQTNLVDWYPFVPPYSPEKGWLAHDAGYFGEHLVYEKSDFIVNIHLLDFGQELTIAASAPAEIDGELRRYEHLNARNFVWSVSHQYQVMEEFVGDVVVLGYSFPFDQAAGAAVLETTVEALKLYQELFGPYPRKHLSVVEADFLDGMEFDGLYFLSNGFYNLYQGTKGEYLIAIAAHETAHQWWYAMVGNDQALEPWLDEAFCTYSERLFYENLYPEFLDWWWQYRIYYYDPQGWVDRTIYDPGGYRAYRDAVYLNGANFFEELRTLMGDPAFFEFIKNYCSENSDQIGTAIIFFDLLESHTNVDYSSMVSLFFKDSNYK